MPDQLTRGAPFLCIASTGCNSGEVAEKAKASIRLKTEV